MSPDEKNPLSSTLGVRPEAPAADLEDRRLHAALGARLFGRAGLTELGRFRIRGRLGSGGMGVVYDAEDPTLQRRVALKVVRPDRDDASARQRMLREARAAARLEHPNLVTVYEVGEHEDTVWIAMEYVDGPTLGDWLRPAEGRPHRHWREIVGVFIDAGTGLAEAHRRGIVHRDFKPANVLVGTASDGHPVPRVADFGLATSVEVDPKLSKSLADLHSSADGDANGPETWVDKVVGTPAYMAPEQFMGAQVDARADQFAFCVALFEALEGRRPFGGNTLAEMLMSIESGEMIRPRRRHPWWLMRAIRKGLDPDPARRHPTLDALLEVLRRGLGRRQRVVMGLAACSAAAAAALGVGLWREDPCGAVDRQAGEVWNPASRAQVRTWFNPEAATFRAESAERFDASFDMWISRWRAQRVEACRAAHVEARQSPELLDRRDACMDRQLRRAAALLSVTEQGTATPDEISGAMRAVSALPPLASCANTDALLGEVVFAGDPDRQLEANALEAALSELEGLIHTAAARDMAASAHELARRAEVLGHDPYIARARFLEARAHVVLGDRDRAYRQFVDAFRAAVRGSHAELSAESALLAAWAKLEHHDDLDLAERWLDDADAFITASGDLPRHRGTWHDYRGVLAYARGDLQEAIAEHRAALELRDGEAGLEVPAAQSQINLAGTLSLVGEVDEAIELYERAERTLDEFLGPNHPMVAKLLTNEGASLYYAGRYEASKTALEDALQRKQAVFGPEHHHLATTLVNLANSQWMLGEKAAAIESLERAIRMRERQLGLTHPRLVVPLINLGDSYRDYGQYEAAMARFRRAEAIATEHEHQGASHLDVIAARAGIAECLTALERDDEALAVYDEQIAPVLEQSDLPLAIKLEVLVAHAQALSRRGHAERAATVAARAITTCTDAGDACEEDPRAQLEDLLDSSAQDSSDTAR